jgi:hypothetical protein
MIRSGLRIGGFSNPTLREITGDGVKPWPGASLPRGRTAFQHFFAPLFPDLDRVFLLAEPGCSPFVGGLFSGTRDADEMDAEFDRWIVDIPMDESLPPPVLAQPRSLLHPPGIVSAWGRAVVDDWCTLIDLGPSEEEAVRVATALVHLEIEDALRILGHPSQIATQEESTARFRSTVLAEARSVLQCIDGMLWELYTDDASRLAAVEAHARSSGPFTVTPVTLEECLKW